MNKIRYLIIPIFLIGLFLMGCEEDGFNEEDIINLTNETDLSVLVQDYTTGIPIKDAQVIIGASGNILQSTTDSLGIAFFYNLEEQGDARIKVIKDGYFLYSNSFDISTSFRSGGENINVYLNSEQDAAYIYGTVSLQIDLTTEESEHPEGVKIKVLNSNNEEVTSTTTDSEGDYFISFPVGSGAYFKLKFPDLEYDQTIVVRENNVVVNKIAYGTVFRPYQPAETLPNTSNITTTIESPPYSWNNYYWQGYVKSITVESGVITDVEIGERGIGYYGYTSSYYSPYDITITSLDGGSGASITVAGTYTYSSLYYPLSTSVTINNGGSGYPTYEANQNVPTTHPSGFIWPGGYFYNELTDTKYLNPGTTLNIDVDYGTGTITGDIR